MNTVLVILVMVAGVIQPQRMEIHPMTGDCVTDMRVVHALNRENQRAGRPIQYLTQCENR